MILVTGGAGFIGGNFVLDWLSDASAEGVINLDKLTYAGNLATLQPLKNDSRHLFVHGDIGDKDLVSRLLKDHQPRAIVNFAAESHVDRSIHGPAEFVQTNILGTFNLLECGREYWSLLEGDAKTQFRFHHVSTDEVYGPAPIGHAHREWVDQHFPSNPYSASKAAQEDICFSYWRTYGIPLAITNTMNIIGETQDPEKFMPMVIKKVLSGDEMSIHASAKGDIGSRFYLHARNQADALLFALTQDFPAYGESDTPERFHVVGEKELNNLEMAQIIAEAVGKPLNYKLEDFHSSRPGHDLRYALDGNKLAKRGWKPPISLADSINRTVEWTLKHPEWLNL